MENYRTDCLNYWKLRGYKKVSYEEFIYRYNVAFVDYTDAFLVRNDLEIEDIQNVDVEIYFVLELLNYVNRRAKAYNELMMRWDRSGRRDVGSFFDEQHGNIFTKEIFLLNKLKQLGYTAKISNEKLNVTPVKPQKEGRLRFEGSVLTLSDRYEIAKELLAVDAKLATLNTTAEEKAKILSLLLGCNEDNAKDLINTQYQKKVPPKQTVLDFIVKIKND